MSRKKRFKTGDIVRHTSTFLRNISWCLDVPINGRVELTVDEWASGQLVKVLWSDGHESGCLAYNLELCPRSKV